MRKTRKVRAAAALLGAATVAALAACSSGSASGEGTGDGATTLTVWHYYNTDGQVEGLEKLATAFEADHPDVDVQFQYVPVEQMTTKAVTAAGAQTGPDVLVFGASGTYPLAQSGAIEPMDDWWSGFADAAHASRAFKAFFHATPGDYRAGAPAHCEQQMKGESCSQGMPSPCSPDRLFQE